MFNLELWKNAFTIRSSIIVHLYERTEKGDHILFVD